MRDIGTDQRGKYLSPFGHPYATLTAPADDAQTKIHNLVWKRARINRDYLDLSGPAAITIGTDVR